MNIWPAIPSTKTIGRNTATVVNVEAITAFVQMEMLEAGYAAVAEFHYLHHQPGGVPYDNLAELSARISAAAATSGIGLTLLPWLLSLLPGSSS